MYLRQRFKFARFYAKNLQNFTLPHALNTKFNLNAIKLSLLVKFDKEKYADKN